MAAPPSLSSPPSPSSSAPEAATQVLELLSQSRFHRRFILPATADHDAFPVTYSDVGAVGGNGEGPPVPVVLFIPGMVASRYFGVYPDHLAAKTGVRVLTIDRPGLGGTPPVPLERRISTWLEIVPALLNHLGISHVIPVAHSDGTIYMLNTIAHLRHLLLPRRPCAMILAPWVDTRYSKVLYMSLVQALPSSVFKYFNHIQGFILKASPLLGASGAALTAIKDAFTVSKSSKDTTEAKLREIYGVGQEALSKLARYAFRFMYMEDTTGINDEVLLCLRRCPSGAWGACDDLAKFVERLVEAEKKNTDEQKLRVQVYFAEDDIMIGRKGQQYFEDCWNEQRLDGQVDFEAVTVEGAAHDSIFDPSNGVFERIFMQARESMEVDSSG